MLQNKNTYHIAGNIGKEFILVNWHVYAQRYRHTARFGTLSSYRSIGIKSLM